jgi:hypothetical protein
VPDLPKSVFVFLAALVGSFAQEALSANREYHTNNDRLPQRYSQISFYLLRIALAVSAALTAVVLANASLTSISPGLLGLITGIAPAPILHRLAKLVEKQLPCPDDARETKNSPTTANISCVETQTALAPDGDVANKLKKPPKKPAARAPTQKKTAPQPKGQNYQ